MTSVMRVRSFRLCFIRFVFTHANFVFFTIEYSLAVSDCVLYWSVVNHNISSPKFQALLNRRHGIIVSSGMLGQSFSSCSQTSACVTLVHFIACLFPEPECFKRCALKQWDIHNCTRYHNLQKVRQPAHIADGIVRMDVHV